MGTKCRVKVQVHGAARGARTDKPTLICHTRRPRTSCKFLPGRDKRHSYVESGRVKILPLMTILSKSDGLWKKNPYPFVSIVDALDPFKTL